MRIPATREKSPMLQGVFVVPTRLRLPARAESRGFARPVKAVGRHLAGKPPCFSSGSEYPDDDANFEPCFTIRDRSVIQKTDPGPVQLVSSITVLYFVLSLANNKNNSAIY